MSRLEVELFDLPPDPDLLCAICQCVIAEPTEASRCRHVFCRVCIGAWLASGARTCPTCRSTLTEFELHAALPILCNVIGRLMMKCINLAQGCQARITVERLDVHLRDDCMYVTERCQCGRDVMRLNQQQHEQTCTSRMIKCFETCQMMISALSRNTHNCAEMLKQALEVERKQHADLKQKFEEVSSKFKELENRVDGWIRGRNQLTFAVSRYDTPMNVNGVNTASTSDATVNSLPRDFIETDEQSVDSYSSADDIANDDGEFTPYTSDDEQASPSALQTDPPMLPEQATIGSGLLDSPASPPYNDRLLTWRASPRWTRFPRNRMFSPRSPFVTAHPASISGSGTSLNASRNAILVTDQSHVSQSPVSVSSQHISYHAPDPRSGRQSASALTGTRQATSAPPSVPSTGVRESFVESDEDNSSSEQGSSPERTPRDRSMSTSLASRSPSSVGSRSVYSEHGLPQSADDNSLHAYSVISSVHSRSQSRSRSPSPTRVDRASGSNSPLLSGWDLSPRDSSSERYYSHSRRQSRPEWEQSTLSEGRGVHVLNNMDSPRGSRNAGRASFSRSRSPSLESESRLPNCPGRYSGFDSPIERYDRNRPSSPASDRSNSGLSQLSSDSYQPIRRNRRRWLSTSILSSRSNSDCDETTFGFRASDIGRSRTLHSNVSSRGHESDEQDSGGHHSEDCPRSDRSRSPSRSSYGRQSNSETSDVDDQEQPRSGHVTPQRSRSTGSDEEVEWTGNETQSSSSCSGVSTNRRLPKRRRSSSNNASQAASSCSSDDDYPRPKRCKRDWVD